MKRMSDIRQNLGAAMFFARDLAQASRLQQTAELSGKDRGLGREVFIKKFLIGIVEKGNCADNLVEHHKRRSHEWSVRQIPSPAGNAAVFK